MATVQSGALEVEYHDDVVVVRLLGEHDIATVDLVREELDRHLDDGVVVCLTQTEFLDSSVTLALRAVGEQLRTRRRQLVLHVATTGLVRRVLELSGLATAVPCTGSLEQAIVQARLGDGEN